MGELSNYYNDLKSAESPVSSPVVLRDVNVPAVAAAWRNRAAANAEKLRDDCKKHLIVDVYCKILPLSDDFKAGHHGQMCNDIDCMLAKNGMTATQYLTSCFESTKAPFVEYLIRSTDLIGKAYMENEMKKLNDAAEKNEKIDDPDDTSIEDQEASDALVDITNDTEYETFIDALRKKTIDKIVRDVSDIIDDKKDDSKMQFNSESAVAAGLDYFQKALWTEDKQIPADVQEEMIGLAIREATLREIDLCFNRAMPFNEFASTLRYGKGILINEAAAETFKTRLA